jgi:hypothetical protein
MSLIRKGDDVSLAVLEKKKAAEKWAAQKRKWLTKPFPNACTPQKTPPRACSGK